MRNLPQYGLNDGRMKYVNTKNLGLITMIIFMFFALTIVRLWLTFLPQMEVAGEETAQLISGEGAATQIINIDFIPEVRLLLILSLVIFGILDGIFALMLWRGNPNPHNATIIMPLFIIYMVGRFFSGFIISILTIPVIVGTNPRLMMDIFYLSVVALVGLCLVIILLFQMKVFSQCKRKATEVQVGRSEGSSP